MLWMLILITGPLMWVQVSASDRISVTSPAGNVSKSGLTIKLTSEGIQKTGYRPVDIMVSCLTPLTVDRRVTIELQPNYRGGSRRNHSTKVRCSVEIPQGAANGASRILVPQIEHWNNFYLTIYDDGELVQDMSGYHGVSYVGGDQGNSPLTEAYPGWLVIDSDDLTNSNFYSTANLNWLVNFCVPQRNNRGLVPNGRDGRKFTADLSTVSAVERSQLPVNWQDYSCYDIVVTSLNDLNQIIQTEKERWNALETFLRSGGTMIVYGVGNSRDDFSKLGELSALLRLAFHPEETTNGRTWRSPNAEDIGERLFFQGQTIQQVQRDGTVVLNRPVVPDAKRRAILDKPRFRLSNYFSGMVVAISDPAPFTGSERWTWIMSSIGSERWKWYERHGMSQVRPNRDFWNFMIPGIDGAAPIAFFLILISGFVFCIGPLNYWFLKRNGRLHLLLFTVPAGALIVILGLLVYVVLADGIDTKVRIRSFTFIDSDARKMTSWSRQMYYSSLSISQGLSFPDTALVYPIDYFPYENKSRRFMYWANGQAHLWSGFIQSRSLAQFLVVNANRTNRGLEIELDSESLKIRNSLGVDVAPLLVVDPEAPTFFLSDRINDGQTAAAAPVTLHEAQSQFQSVLNDSELQMAAGFDVPRRRRFSRWRIDRNEAEPGSASSVLERGVSELTLSFQPNERVYYAVTRSRPTTVPKGIQKANEQAGFHLIKGTW